MKKNKLQRLQKKSSIWKVSQCKIKNVEKKFIISHICLSCIAYHCLYYESRITNHESRINQLTKIKRFDNYHPAILPSNHLTIYHKEVII
jgi:hypothetical protein